MQSKKNIYFKLFFTAIVLVITLNFNVFANNTQAWNSYSFIGSSLPSIEYYNGVYVLASDLIYTSKDRENWTETFSPAINGSYNQINALNNEFIATGKEVQVVKSSDGENWLPLRLHNNISPKDINTIGENYFWTNSEEELSYSKNLLTWNKISIPTNEPIMKKVFVNDKCFISTGVNEYSLNHWILDKDLTPIPIKLGTSIDNISYLSETKTYVNIISEGSTGSKRLYCMTSNDGITWEKSDLILDENQTNTVQTDQFNIMNLGGKIFLNLDNEIYVTSNNLNWNKIRNYGNIKELKYSGSYFYNISNLTDVFISKNGIDWTVHSLPNEINILSTINIYNDVLFVVHTDFDNNSNMYKSTAYSYILQSFDKEISDIVKIIQTSEPSTSKAIEPDTNKAIEPNTEITTVLKEVKTIRLEIGSTKLQLTDGSMIDISSPALIVNDNTMIPLRSVITAFNGSTQWDSENKKATVKCNDKTIELVLGSKEAKIDGKIFVLPEPFKLVKDIGMVPLRPIMENLGYEIQWIADTKNILIMH